MTLRTSTLQIGPQLTYEGDLNSYLEAALDVDSDTNTSRYRVAYDDTEVIHQPSGSIKNTVGGLYPIGNVPLNFTSAPLPQEGEDASNQTYEDIYFYTGSGTAIQKLITAFAAYNFKIKNIFADKYKNAVIHLALCRDFTIENTHLGFPTHNGATEGLGITLNRCSNFTIKGVTSFMQLNYLGVAMQDNIGADRHSLDFNSAKRGKVSNVHIYQMTFHGLQSEYITTENSHITWLTVGNPDWEGGDKNLTFLRSTIFSADINQNCHNILFSTCKVKILTIQSEANKLTGTVTVNKNSKLHGLVFTGSLAGNKRTRITDTVIDTSYNSQDNPCISINAFGVPVDGTVNNYTNMLANAHLVIKNGLATGSNWAFLEVYPTDTPFYAVIDGMTYKGGARYLVVARTGATGKIMIKNTQFLSSHAQAALIGRYSGSSGLEIVNENGVSLG